MSTTKRVLSVDDDPVNQAVIEFLLEGNNYQVIQAMDGMEALQYLDSSTANGDGLPDLILLDVMMPGLSGYEVCVKIREKYPASLPVIMISAKCSREDIVKGLECKCNDYVTKPFDKEELLARIEMHVKLNTLRIEQEAITTRKEIERITLPSATIPLQNLFFITLILLGDDEVVRSHILQLASQCELIHIPSRLEYFYFISSKSKSVVEFFQKIILSKINSTIFVSQFNSVECLDFGDIPLGIAPSKFLFGPSFSQHMKLVATTHREIEVPFESYNLSSIVCFHDLVPLFSSPESLIKTNKSFGISRIFSPSQSKIMIDDIDPLTANVSPLDLIAASCGARPYTHYKHLCLQNLSDALESFPEHSLGSEKQLHSNRLETILCSFNGTNGHHICEEICKLLAEITVAISRVPEQNNSSDIDAILAHIADESHKKNFREYLLEYIRNERIRNSLVSREAEYTSLVNLVNENLKNILKIESLNEVMYLEVQRRIFDSRSIRFRE